MSGRADRETYKWLVTRTQTTVKQNSEEQLWQINDYNSVVKLLTFTIGIRERIPYHIPFANQQVSSTHPLVKDHIERNKAKESQYGSVRIFDVELRSRYLSCTSNSFHKVMLYKIRRKNNQLVSSCSSIA